MTFLAIIHRAKERAGFAKTVSVLQGLVPQATCLGLFPWAISTLGHCGKTTKQQQQQQQQQQNNNKKQR